MVKIRLKRLGYKKHPTFRIVVLNSTTKREAAPIQQLGFYNPKTKEMKLDKQAALEWIGKGAQPTKTVQFLINNCTEEGTLNYVKKETVKLSKKAQQKFKLKKKLLKKQAKKFLHNKDFTGKENTYLPLEKAVFFCERILKH